MSAAAERAPKGVRFADHYKESSMSPFTPDMILVVLVAAVAGFPLIAICISPRKEQS